YGSPLLWARCVPAWKSSLGPIDPTGMTSLRKDGFLQDGDGGVYWLIASALPAFRAFRYPGKFLVFTALAVSALAGAGWARLVAGRSRRPGWIAGGVLAASLAGLAAAWLCEGWMRAELTGFAEAAASGYGPLDVPGAIADLRAALGQGALAF